MRQGGLTGGFYGLLPATVHILGNSYKGKHWPTSDSTGGEEENDMELKALDKDIKRFRYWGSRVKSQVDIEEAGARGQLVRDALQIPRTSSRMLYIGGHTTRQNGEPVYLPADCYEAGPQTVALGLPFSEMRDLLLKDSLPRPLLLVTDFCDGGNVLRLPYVLCYDSAESYWKETNDCVPSDWPSEKTILHYAAADKDREAHEFTTIGGIFTREFCNISPRKHMSLAERSRSIRNGMDTYFNEYELDRGIRLEQKHQVYSSHKLDLNDVRPLKRLGFSQ